MWCSLVIVPLLALPMVATPATDPAGAAAKQVEMPPKRYNAYDGVYRPAGAPDPGPTDLPRFARYALLRLFPTVLVVVTLFGWSARMLLEGPSPFWYTCFVHACKAIRRFVITFCLGVSLLRVILTF